MKHKLLLTTAIPTVFALSTVTCGLGLFVWNTNMTSDSDRTVSAPADFQVKDNIYTANSNIKIEKANPNFKLAYENDKTGGGQNAGWNVEDESGHSQEGSSSNHETYYTQMQRVFQVPVLKFSMDINNTGFQANRLPYGFGVSETGALITDNGENNAYGKFINDNAKLYWSRHVESFDQYVSPANMDYDKGAKTALGKGWKFKSDGTKETKEFYYPVCLPLLAPMDETDSNKVADYKAFVTEDVYVTLTFNSPLFKYIVPKFYDTEHSRAIKTTDITTSGATNKTWIKKDGEKCNDATDPDAVFCKTDKEFRCTVSIGTGYPLFRYNTGVRYDKQEDMQPDDLNKGLNTTNFLTLNKQYSGSSIDGVNEKMLTTDQATVYGNGVMSDSKGPVEGESNACPEVTKQRLFGYTETMDTTISDNLASTTQKTSSSINSFVSPISLTEDADLLGDGATNRDANWTAFKNMLKNGVDGSEQPTTVTVTLDEVGLAYKIVDNFHAEHIAQIERNNSSAIDAPTAQGLINIGSNLTKAQTFWNTYAAADTQYIKLYPTASGEDYLHIDSSTGRVVNPK